MDVPDGRVVVKQEPSGGDECTVDFDPPLAHRLDRMRKRLRAVGVAQRSKRHTGWGDERRRRAIGEQDRFARDLGGAITEHEREEDVVRLRLHHPRTAGGDERAEQTQRAAAMGRSHEEAAQQEAQWTRAMPQTRALRWRQLICARRNQNRAAK